MSMSAPALRGAVAHVKELEQTKADKVRPNSCCCHCYGGRGKASKVASKLGSSKTDTASVSPQPYIDWLAPTMDCLVGWAHPQKKLESQVADLRRQNSKLQEQVSRLGEKVWCV